MPDFIDIWRRRAESFVAAAHDLFGRYETSKSSRVFSLTQTWNDLGGLSLVQESLFRDALRCVERGVFRAAHVMAWAGFMDFLEDIIAEGNLKKLHSLRPAWQKHKSLEELRENVPEFQLLDAARDLGVLSKAATKTLHGLLAKRNECAHPGAYEPEVNEALGFISELLARIKTIQQKRPKEPW